MRTTSADAPDGAAAPEERWQRLWPFAATFGLAIVLTYSPAASASERAALAASALLVVATTIALVAVPWHRMSPWWTLVPVLAATAIVHLLRVASGTGIAGGYSSLLLLPVIWQALYRPARVLGATIAVVALANVVAVAALPSPVSGSAQARSIVLFTVAAAAVGITIHRLSIERRRLVGTLERRATHDPLTDLANRNAWEDLAVAATMADAAEESFVAMIDLDHFKRYNDEHGHAAGDALLVAAADSWRQGLRPDDLLVRWGGEEFALLLPATSLRRGIEVLDRLQRSMPFGQTFSAGYAAYRPGDDPKADLQRAVDLADQALYVAKRRGRGRLEAAGHRPIGS